MVLSPNIKPLGSSVEQSLAWPMGQKATKLSDPVEVKLISLWINPSSRHWGQW